MQGISILIVDDDKLLVQKLEKTMKWEKLGITTVLTAYNIRQARTLMEEYPVQLLLCDIDMPQGNGLELLEWVREQKMDIECVFLSSYANFSYAQMALRLSSKEYLLKPISNADLERALERVLKDVVKKKKRPVCVEDEQNKKLWEDLLLRRIPDGYCIADGINKGIYHEEDRFCFVMIRLMESEGRKIEKKDVAIHDFILRNVSEEFFQSKRLHKSPLEALVRIGDVEWMMVLNCGAASDAVSEQAVVGKPDNDKHMSSLLSHMEELMAQLRKVLDCRVGIYLGSPTFFKDAGNARDSLEELEEQSVLDEDYILYGGGWKRSRLPLVEAPWEAWQKELSCTNRILDTEEHMLEYVERQRRLGGWSRRSLDEFLRRTVQMLYHYLGERKWDYSQIFDHGEFSGYEEAARLSMVGAKEFISYIFQKLDANQSASSDKKDVVRQMKDYIEQNLSQTISRSDLARTVYLSEGYLSKIFLKETGVSLPAYIAERRIEKAKEYLEHSMLPVSRIAIEVGFHNFSYFSKTFRELTGCTPNEYRTRINKKEHKGYQKNV